MNNKPNYYNRFAKPPKPKMSNSLELLTGPINSVQKHYEILSDIVTEVNGKFMVHNHTLMAITFLW